MKHRYISAYSATGSRTPHAWRVQMRAGGKQFCRVLPFSRYGGREDALAWAVRLRDKVQAMLDMGAEPAWAFYIYGGAARPAHRPTVVVL